jgi:hypothetical protein
MKPGNFSISPQTTLRLAHSFDAGSELPQPVDKLTIESPTFSEQVASPRGADAFSDFLLVSSLGVVERLGKHLSLDGSESPLQGTLGLAGCCDDLAA